MKNIILASSISVAFFLRAGEIQKNNSSLNIAEQVPQTNELGAVFKNYTSDSATFEKALSLFQKEMDIDRLIIMQTKILILPEEQREKFNLPIANKCKALFQVFENLPQDQKELFFEYLILNLLRCNDELGKVALEYYEKFPSFKFPSKLDISNIGYRNATEYEMKGMRGVCVALSISNFDLKQLDTWIDKYYSDSVNPDMKLLILWGMGFSSQPKCLDFLASLNLDHLDERGKIIREIALKRVSIKIENFQNNILKKYIINGDFSGKIPDLDSSSDLLIKYKTDLDKNWSRLEPLIEKFSKSQVAPVSKLYPIW